MLLRDMVSGDSFRWNEDDEDCWEYRGNGWYGRPYSGGPFHTYDNPVVVSVPSPWPQDRIPPAGSVGSKYGYDEHGRLCHRDSRELVH